MIWIYSVIGVLIGVLLPGLAIWFGISPSLSERKSCLPQPSGNSVQPYDANITDTGNEGA
ncbi:hypothetical protein GFM13_32225 [Rhizobium leguminosarum bv. viciae]|nr:hypothetical protein [Rhizobium leguminosarum bv. viciae]